MTKILYPAAKTLALYNLSRDDFAELWSVQCGECEICRKRFTRSRPACIDHDHKTYEVRGLLCRACNYQLGLLHDNVEWLRNAADYLTYQPAHEAFDKPPRVAGAPPIKEKK